MRAARNVAGGMSTIGELFQFLWAHRLWWLMPFVAVLILAAVLLIVGEITGVAPFIYTLF
ncbi:MAG: hypothetical protein V7647_3809 [Acidobacteriota bacterium]|jgi:uncharacterized membrane protein YqhA